MLANLRAHKGHSVISLPSDYTVIDIETTGLDYATCHIIEISALRVRNNIAVDSFSSLVQPVPDTFIADDGSVESEYVGAFITALTGITNQMLETAPLPADVMPQFLSFVGDDLLVGHNVGFDVNFIYDSCGSLGLLFPNDFIDTMRISRKLLPDLPHHRLRDIAEYYSVPNPQAHRSSGDCLATNGCYQNMRSQILCQMSESEFSGTFQRRYEATGRLRGKREAYQKLSDAVPTGATVDKTNPLYGKTVVFTGGLSSMLRKDAMRLVERLGGVCGNSITRSTNFLVIGNEDFVSSVKNGKTAKMKKAEELILKGYDLQILSEDVFMSMLQAEDGAVGAD